MQATKEDYLANMGKTLKLGKREVTVCSYKSESKSGSWSRGFKWTYTTYGYLTCRVKKSKYYHPMMYSFDHGVTWHDTASAARKVKGKIKLEVRKDTEFAFNSIQVINRQYDPGYQWRP
jgi:hypothetical protein